MANLESPLLTSLVVSENLYRDEKIPVDDMAVLDGAASDHALDEHAGWHVVDPGEDLAGVAGQSCPVERRCRIAKIRVTVGEAEPHRAAREPVARPALENERPQ